MKYILVLLVVGVAIWIWRRTRADEAAERREQQAAKAAQPQRTPVTPQAMVACRHCGTHIAQSEATQGHLGWYCDRHHRQLSEGQ